MIFKICHFLILRFKIIVKYFFYTKSDYTNSAALDDKNPYFNLSGGSPSDILDINIIVINVTNI